MSMTLSVHEGWLLVPPRPLPGPDQIFYDFDREIATAADDRVFAERIATLTARELEVLRLRAQGLSNDEIADRCFLSSQTIKNHLHRAVRKLVRDGIDGPGKLNRTCYLLGRWEWRQERQRDLAQATGWEKGR